MKQFLRITFVVIGVLSIGWQTATAGRMYDPELSRFMSIDPILEEKAPNDLLKIHQGKLYSYNPYNYTFNNPLRYVDPDGKTPWDIIDIGFAVASVYDAFSDPSASNIFWASVDVVAAAAPIVPSSRGFRMAADAVSAGKNATKVPILEGIVQKGGKHFADSKTVNSLGKKLNFSDLKSTVEKTKDATWQGEKTGGLEQIVKYTDKDGNTIAIVHQVTDAKGNIVHRDFDAVRLDSGQMINKDRKLDD